MNELQLELDAARACLVECFEYIEDDETLDIATREGLKARIACACGVSFNDYYTRGINPNARVLAAEITKRRECGK